MPLHELTERASDRTSPRWECPSEGRRNESRSPLAAARFDACKHLHSTLQRFATLGVRRPPSLQSQRQKLLLRRSESFCLAFFIEPFRRLVGMSLDLASQLVADGPRRLDLAPHARRDFQARSKGLLQPLGRNPFCDGVLGIGLEQRQDIAPPIDGDVDHVLCSDCNFRRSIVAGA